MATLAQDAYADVLPRPHTEATSSTTQTLQAFAVPFAFPVVFTENLFHASNRTLADAVRRLEADKRHRICVFVDGGLLAARPGLPQEIADYCTAHAAHLELVGDVVETPAGEAAKNDIALIERYQKILYDRHIDRHSYVVAIGGGAALDAVGFVAATCHRGVRIIRVPSTTLAQNDAGIGVKNGVNLFGSKNFMGAFAPPFAVLNDIAMLETLNDRDRRAGLAEAVKVALIRDGDFFTWLEDNANALGRFERAAMAEQIERCADLHLRQITQGGDPFELGSARPLDFGHWSAHKLEGLTGHAMRHGEAVAIGVALDTRYSVLKGFLPEADGDRVYDALAKMGFTLWDDALAHPGPDGRPAVLKGLADFQEHLGGELTITLLKGLGVAHDVHEMDHELLVAAMDWLRDRARSA